jgi:hypothetical protein
MVEFEEIVDALNNQARDDQEDDAER